MTETIAIALIVVGLLGTFLPVLPGLVLSFAGLLVLEFGGDRSFPDYWLWIFGVLTILSVVLNYIIPARTNKKYGGTRYGSIGSVIGTILGIIFIPIPFGFLIGMLAGVFLGELLHDAKDKGKALRSAKGALIGFLYGTGFNFAVGVGMLVAAVIHLVN